MVVCDQQSELLLYNSCKLCPGDMMEWTERQWRELLLVNFNCMRDQSADLHPS